MKTRKAIAYAYPTSPAAEHLGMGRVGCFYLSVSVLRDDGNWSYYKPAHNAEGYSEPDHPDLVASYTETDGEICPYFATHGNDKALSAIRANQAVTP